MSRGLTYEEAGELAGVEDCWRRVSDLLNLGLIEPIFFRGRPCTRMLSSRRRGRIYRVTDKGVLIRDDDDLFRVDPDLLARTPDPVTSHWAAEGDRSTQLVRLLGVFRRHTRPGGRP